ncbi:MAG: GntR family transcriptional regulator [Bacteroidales bacterium]|nr:GntR family transcriptional regulator [Bacteroidales bacterium]
MLELGRYNTLTVAKVLDFGLYLDAGPDGQVLMPARYVPHGVRVGDQLRAFIYLDSDDRPLATTLRPLVQVGQFAPLRCVAVNRVGAFLDWGLPKDLLVPFGEQRERMVEGRAYVVYCYIDPDTHRIAASARLARFLDQQPPAYQPGQPVQLMPLEQTDLGYRAIVDDQHTGMLYHNEVFRPLRWAERLQGYVKQVRPDGKIDLTLQRTGYGRIDGAAQLLLDTLRQHGGFLPLTDRSAPADIYNALQMSKKSFKMALGALYKQHLVSIEPDGIMLLE